MILIVSILFCLWLLGFVERRMNQRIDLLHARIKKLEDERRVVLADGIKLRWVSLQLPPGTCILDRNGVREVSTIPVMSFVSGIDAVKCHG
jgi:hypothetical protein